MTPNYDTPQEEEFAGLLAACDDALAAGEPPPTDGPAEAPTEMRPRLERGLSCLRRLQQLRPGHTPMPTLPALTSPDGAIVARVGRFEVVRELGRGGFGIVYLARDPALDREVALKVPHAEVLVTPEMRDRFSQEARAAAALDHPHLLPVYEVGQAGPFGYLVSPYCPGGSLAQWLRRRTEPIPPRMAAELIEPLAEAVAHAHGRGILHRDIKPANILLQRTGDRGQRSEVRGQRSGDGEATESVVLFLSSVIPKLADFGLAKLLDEADGLTRTGMILGTPSYMAPEQASGRRGNVGPAADVYALGAVLYELLTGRPPFEADSAAAALNQVLYLDPVPPRRLRPSVPRDLETICLKCLEKDSKRRYTSAQALGDDLGRFLEGQPVRARRVGPLGRAWRWAKRRPAVAALLLALVLTLVGGFVAVYDQWQRAQALAEANGRERDDARRARDRAEAHYHQARAVVDRLSQLGTELATLPGTDATRQAVVEEVLKYFEQFANERGDDAAARLNLARASYRTGRLRQHLGRPDAEQALLRAGELFEGLIAEAPDDSLLRRERALCLRWLGTIHRQARRDAQALPYYAEAITILERLTVEQPDSAWDTIELANTLLNRSGLILDMGGRQDEVEATLNRIHELNRRALAAQPKNLIFRQEAALAEHQAADLYVSRNRLAEAEEPLRRSIELFEGIVVESKDDRHPHYLARVRVRLAEVYRRSNRPAESFQLYSRTADDLERLVAQRLGVPAYRELLGDVRAELALLHAATGRPEAEDSWRQALAHAQRLATDYPSEKRYATDAQRRRNYLADWLDKAGRQGEAAALRALPPTPR
jgi:hypothetical protein